MKFFKILISLTITLLIAYFLLAKVTAADLLQGIKLLDVKLLFFAFLIYIAVNIIRAYRFDLILGKNVGCFKFLNIIFLQNFFNVILPFRLGELSYVHWVNRLSDVGIGKNVASLLSARLLDFLSVISIFIIAFIILFQKTGHFLILFLALSTWIIIISFLILLIFYGEKVIIFFLWLKNILRLDKVSFFNFFSEKIKEGVETFLFFRRQKHLWGMLLLSFTIWGLTFFMGHLLFKSIGISFNFLQTIFIYSFPIFVSLIPFYTLAGLGLYEGSVASGLILFGIANEKAITTGFILHAEELFFVIIPALFGYIMLRVIRLKNER